ncbi:hypothetical protein Ngar_c09130 [Candidatus Nitrososphaera gargensis Ga9.2]|uniref:Membrane-bound metal-dependent hydrolase n=1 Tax=Nitrososphaera gargensis (strain Ga9.2) TaxID=1237085 RepID=K0IDR1_NITGG|nr:metal-dependent hydrolase [Candidatus Nitrososphaera gargensis]AFU57855.1 hypothetical protein Ngar_c09130 [Candidatus Nitrososphaera gargensis Ga9.2]
MYLVGHAIVGFLIAYTISKKFKVGGISFALVMLIACLPDIDIIFQSLGIMSHKTYTHSLILSATIVPSIIFAIARWKKVSAVTAFVYSLAYVQHIIMGDIAVGSINILYPFGEMVVGSGIGYGTLAHQTIESLLLAAAAAVVLNRTFKKEQPDTVVLLRYNNIDKVSYLLLIGSLTVSFAYLLYGVKILPRLFIETDLELAVFIILHLSTMAWMSFTMLVARQSAILGSLKSTRSY